jgi:hypothetical protein
MIWFGEAKCGSDIAHRRKGINTSKTHGIQSSL